MRMYDAKQWALSPLLTARPATEHVGRLMLAGRWAALASAAIPFGVMSGVPTICSCLRLSLTVLRPFMPMTIAHAYRILLWETDKRG